MPTPDGNFVAVPALARLDLHARLRHADDRPGAVRRVGTLVEDVHLVARRGPELRGILAAQEHSAIGIRGYPELEVEVEVAIGGLGEEKARAGVGSHGAIGKLPVGVADLLPTVEARSVEQRLPWTGLRLRRRRALRTRPRRAPAQIRTDRSSDADTQAH